MLDTKQNVSGNTMKKIEESEQIRIQIYLFESPKDRVWESFVSKTKLWRRYGDILVYVHFLTYNELTTRKIIASKSPTIQETILIIC